MSDAGSVNETGRKRVRKLRWKCRRGMKELDILLETFIDANEASLAAGKWPELEQLLALEDDRLWDCVRQSNQADCSVFKALIDMIRRPPASHA